MLPHSAEVIAPQTPLPIQPVDAAIPRAFTLRLAEGLVSEATDRMRFAAQPAGDYLIFCGVAGARAAGGGVRGPGGGAPEETAALSPPGAENRSIPRAAPPPLPPPALGGPREGGALVGHATVRRGR